MKNQNKQTKNSFILLTLVAFVAILLGACCHNKDCKDLTTREVSITHPIQGIIFDGPWEVFITQDSVTNSTLLEYCSNYENKITAELRANGYLYLKARGSFHHNIVLRANIKATSLEKIDASGATDIRTSGYFYKLNDIKLSGASNISGLSGEGHSIALTLSGASIIKSLAFTGNTVNADISGASEAKITNLNLEYCKVDCSGASIFEGSGYAATTSFTGSGASDIKTLNLQSENLDIDLSGASIATVFVNNLIKGRLTGASTLKYKGAANVGVSTSGGSTVISLN